MVGAPNWQWTFVNEADWPAVPVAAAASCSTRWEHRFVLLPDIASDFGVRSGAGERSMMAAERSTIGSVLFIAHHLKRLQGDRIAGFEIDGMLSARAGEEGRRASCTGSDGRSTCRRMGLSKTDQRDLKFILTDLRHAGLLAYVEVDVAQGDRSRRSTSSGIRIMRRDSNSSIGMSWPVRRRSSSRPWRPSHPRPARRTHRGASVSHPHAIRDHA